MGRHHQPTRMTGIALLLPITLSTMAIVLLAPILPKLLDEYKGVPNFDYWVPMVLTVPALCVALFSPVAGIMGDWFGRRRLLLWSFGFYALLGIAPVLLHGLGAMLLQTGDAEGDEQRAATIGDERGGHAGQGQQAKDTAQDHQRLYRERRRESNGHQS